MSSFYIELIGSLAAFLTTLCWVPQAWRTIRTRDTRAISLLSQIGLNLGILLWLVYGVMIESWPLILSNAFTFLLVATILSLKLRHG